MDVHNLQRKKVGENLCQASSLGVPMAHAWWLDQRRTENSVCTHERHRDNKREKKIVKEKNKKGAHDNIGRALLPGTFNELARYHRSNRKRNKVISTTGRVRRKSAIEWISDILAPGVIVAFSASSSIEPPPPPSTIYACKTYAGKEPSYEEY